MNRFKTALVVGGNSGLGLGIVIELLKQEYDFVLPEKYDDYLTHVYGDYMTLPPIEKRVAHHYCDVIDTKRGYKEYIGE